MPIVHDANHNIPKLDLMFDYLYLIEVYSTRVLSVATDKLPAFSGLTTRLFGDVGMNYVAGVWEDGIRQYLLWRSPVRHESSHGLNHHLYVAPTWSWASMPSRIEFIKSLAATEVEHDWPGNLELLKQEQWVKNQRFQFGEITHAEIVVQVRSKKLMISPATSIDDARWKGYISWDAGRWTDPPNIGDHIVMYDNLLIAGLGFHSRFVSPTAASVISETEYKAVIVQVYVRPQTFHPLSLRCLLLKPAKSKDGELAYERVAYISLWKGCKKCESPAQLEEWKAKERQEYEESIAFWTEETMILV